MSASVIADAVFQGEPLAPILEVLGVARASQRMALQNFAVAIAYNVVSVPLAMMGYVTPLIAALAMSLSSIAVTGNALRLRKRKLTLGAEANVMTSLAWLIPCALALGALALAAFLWALHSGQFDDLEGAGWRAIQDDEDPGAVSRKGLASVGVNGRAVVRQEQVALGFEQQARHAKLLLRPLGIHHHDRWNPGKVAPNLLGEPGARHERAAGQNQRHMALLRRTFTCWPVTDAHARGHVLGPLGVCEHTDDEARPSLMRIATAAAASTQDLRCG